ncbi:Tachykinin family protein [Pleurostoma richardsiae]|uniref:Tachykinin family protein n=1 Tax=Pleurostoma richardsiae TaxID=41990 RepID=A0AA38R907_9PEZI|nr:Tachykinin family protein [Pleurostoma richardsiae]
MEEGSEPPPANPEPAAGATEFTFVLDQNQHGVRSHAMREYWRRRHKRSRSLEKRSTPHRHRHLLPNKSDQSRSSSSQSDSDAASRSASALPAEEAYNLEHILFPHQQQRLRSQFDVTGHQPAGRRHASIEDMAVLTGGIPAQVLAGVNRALACSRLDPFDMFPVKLTAQHHRLLHHWLSTHAAMMFEELPTATFNPMRDVWFPLDLSNAASFNAIMAHAAAHLARLHGIKTSDEVLKYKAEAVRIVRLWMDDPGRALNDEVFAAVIRLLTFERYWGTEAEWRVHRSGLQHMIEARGGITALQSNWRLELVAYLVSLMAKPSWFDSSNNIFELSEQPTSIDMHPMRNMENLRHVRCLWLLSFIQDMRTFLTNSPELRMHGLRQYPAVQDALLLLQADMKRHTLAPFREEACTAQEFARLACLFFISVLLQAAASSHAATPPHLPSDLAVIDAFLDSRNIWAGSVEDLHDALFHQFAELPDSLQKTNYVVQMTNVLASLSCEARRGVERCLLHILCQVGSGGDASSSDNNWTPDTLLSSLRGL